MPEQSSLPLDHLDPLPVVTCTNCGAVRPSKGRWLRAGLRAYTDPPLGGPVCGPCGAYLAVVIPARGGRVTLDTDIAVLSCI